MQETHHNNGKVTREFIEQAELSERMLAASEKIGSVKSVKFQKIGRNDTCPCGSGFKFKKCCISRMGK